MRKDRAIMTARQVAREENFARDWYVVKSDYYDAPAGRDYYPATYHDILSYFVGEPVVYHVRS